MRFMFILTFSNVLFCRSRRRSLRLLSGDERARVQVSRGTIDYLLLPARLMVTIKGGASRKLQTIMETVSLV